LNILVTNDDGVYSDSIWALAEELHSVGSVTIVAPDRDQSGTGTSITMRYPLRLIEIKSLIKGINAYSVEGTPADSVILALRHAVKDTIDLVVSGINEGPNLGNDTYISGTVGAALQGYFYGIPSIAISLAAFKDLQLDIAAKLAKIMAVSFREGILPKKVLLNTNLPNLPKEKIKGIEITRLGERSYLDNVDTGHDGKRDYYWIVRGIPEWIVEKGTDIWALEQEMISITPLPDNRDASADKILKEMKDDIYHKFLYEL
jgi:5'-nucleotidase